MMELLSGERDLVSREWDYIVVGTGIGGGTLGHALAKAGFSVLFCEKGRSYQDAPDALTGDWLEALTKDVPGGADARHKQRAGRFSEYMVDISERKPRRIQPMIGIGTGGSSALYGMVMERFFPADFTPARYFPDASDANLPSQWPVSFDEMTPFYEAAERLYGVKATADPLRPPHEARGVSAAPPFSAAAQELADGFQAKGLHPYHLPVACNLVPGCQECVGYLCPMRCKRDSVTTCLMPALRDHDAGLLTECEVVSLESTNRRVSAVNARIRGQSVQLRAKTVILAAGALHSPAILLRSDGLANGSDQVGRNLMRHFIDYYILYPKTADQGGLLKQLALNDLYLTDGMKFGTLQSNGSLPSAQSLAAGFRGTLEDIWPPLARLFPLIRPFAEIRAEQIRSHSYSLVAFCEDLPYRTNRITLSADKAHIQLSYHISPHDQLRLKRYRDKIREILAPMSFRTIYRAHQNQVLGHVCGTCRFGDDPATSVLDRNNRAHEVDNLYLVDGSFMPTSSGTNPSLTIAANALRVAAVILNGGVRATPSDKPPVAITTH
jgi:choline dehydrogenase-like flavoprotein